MFYDSKGDVVATCGDGPNNPAFAGPPFIARYAPADIARLEVQERPYLFVQFDNVCFRAPDIAACTGEEGLAREVASPIGKVIGTLKSTKDGAWTGSVLYAADGVRWLDPGPDISAYEFGMFDPWNHPLDNRWTILFAPNSQFLPSSTPTRCELYAADSPDGPNQERLTSWNELPLAHPISQIPCSPTKRPYVRLEIRVGVAKWRSLETVAVSDRIIHLAETAALGSRILEVSFHDDGSITIWRDEANPVQSQFRWRPGEQRIRVLAHLRNGSTAEADFNSGGYSGSSPSQNSYRGLSYTRQTNGTLVHSGTENIDIKDIAAFDLQVQDLNPSVTIPLHSPKD